MPSKLAKLKKPDFITNKPHYLGYTRNNILTFYIKTYLAANKITEETKAYVKGTRKIYNFQRYNRNREEIRNKVLEVVRYYTEYYGYDDPPVDYYDNLGKGSNIVEKGVDLVICPTCMTQTTNIQHLFPEANNYITRTKEVKNRTYHHNEEINQQEWDDSLSYQNLEDLHDEVVILLADESISGKSMMYYVDVLEQAGVDVVIPLVLQSSSKIIEVEPPLVEEENEALEKKEKGGFDILPKEYLMSIGMDHDDETDDSIYDQYIELCYELAEEQHTRQMGKPGRPPKFSLKEVPHVIRKMLYHSARGASKEELAVEIGILPQNMRTMEKNSPWFRVAMELCHELSYAWWARVGRKNLLNKKGFNTALYEKQMRLRFPDKCGDTKTVNVTMGGTIGVDHDISTVHDALKGLSDEQLEILTSAVVVEEEQQLLTD